MKHLAAAAIALTLITSPALAGGVVEPILDPVVIVEDTSSSNGGILVPILALIFVLTVVSG